MAGISRVDRSVSGLHLCYFLVIVLAPFYVASAAENATLAGTKGEADVRRLEGRWVRPDGGYILELKEIKKNGSLKAAYFNPRKINISKAEWRLMGDRLQVFVELRDINYPGSAYTLVYSPEKDRLEGYYFQAVEKQTYTIEFVRNH